MSTAVPVHDQLQASVALERRKESEMRSTGNVSAMQLLQMAVQQGAAIDTIERLAALQEKMFRAEAEMKFGQALQRAQQRMRRIGTDKFNTQTKSGYTSYSKLDSVIRPIYTEEGFALSFDTGDPPFPETVRVLCYVSHADGFTRTYKIDMPADGKGAKGGDVMTKTHATGAASMYGRRYLLNMIFNTSIGETDDDGNGASGKKEMSPEDFTFWEGKISEAKDMDDLNAKYQAACDAAGSDQGAKDSFKKTANKKWREFGGGK